MRYLTSDKVITELPFTPEQVIKCLQSTLQICEAIVDRLDLHERSVLERFNDIAMGELSEQAVMKWLGGHGKSVSSAVDKTSGRPDRGYDLSLRSIDGRALTCSVKSSLSGRFDEMDKILDTFTIATKKSEICDVNIQVYFWLKLYASPRILVPSEHNMAIIGWLGRKDFEDKDFASYKTEAREAPTFKLRNLRAMETLLDRIG